MSDRVYTYPQGIYVLSTIIGVLLQGYLLQYLVRLERTGCKCSRGWDFYYIFAFVIAMFVYELVFGWFLMSQNTAKMAKLILSAHLPMLLGTVVFIIAVFMYIKRVKAIKCACSDDAARDVMELVAKIYTLVITILIIMSILTAILFRV